MLVAHAPRFQAEFPEQFPWDCVNQERLGAAAQTIAYDVTQDLRSARRSLTPGLRKALVIIAEYAVVSST